MSSQGSPEMWKSGSPDEIPDKLTNLKVKKSFSSRFGANFCGPDYL
jgi:hypothetical protein